MTELSALPADFTHNPYSTYTRFRAEAPAHRVVIPSGTAVWVVTRYEDARSVLADPTVVKDYDFTQSLMNRHLVDPSRRRVINAELMRHMLSSDPPKHTRLRRLINKAFTAGRIERLRPRVRSITINLLSGIPVGRSVDLLEEFAFPLPITVITELLGVPGNDRAEFRGWSNAIMNTGDPQRTKEASMAMVDYLHRLIADKRTKPEDDLLTELIQATEDGDRLTEAELVAMVFLLLIAGHETTVNLIGNGLTALLDNPDQLAAVRANLALLPNAIEEFLRYEGPVNLATVRATTKPLVLDGVTIPPEEIILVALDSANRDADRFTDPDRVDITRQAGGHLAFGHGIHYCLGAPLARMEAEIAFGELLTRFPTIKLAVPREELLWRDSILMRGLETLPVIMG